MFKLLKGLQVEIKNTTSQNEYYFLLNEQIEESLEEVVVNIEKIIENSLQTSKIELLAYKFYSLQFLLRSPKILNIIEALSMMKSREKHSDKVLQLISRYFDSISSLLSMFDKSIGDVNNFFSEICNMTYRPKSDVDSDYYSEKFIYKVFIELISNQREIIESLMNSVSLELEYYKSLNREYQYANVFKEFYGIHMYLNTISLKNFLNIKSKDNAVKKIEGYINELDGIIVRIEGKIKAMKLEKVQIEKNIGSSKIKLSVGHLIILLFFILF